MDLEIKGWHELFIVVRGRETFYDNNNVMITFDSKEEAQSWIDTRRKVMAKTKIVKQLVVGDQKYRRAILQNPKGKATRVHLVTGTKTEFLTLCGRSFGEPEFLTGDIEVNCPDCLRVMKAFEAGDSKYRRFGAPTFGKEQNG